MTLDGVTRREFIKLALGTTAGVACGLNPLESEASEGDYDFQMPPDRELKQYLSQPVEDTIGTPGVDYIPVKDENYDQIVKGSNKPVMVLFYCNEGEYSTGLAGLAKVLNDTFQSENVKEGYAGDDILFCAYKVSDEETVDYDEGTDLEARYPIGDIPALAFYAINNNKMECIGSYDGGPSELDRLKKDIQDYMELIPKNML